MKNHFTHIGYQCIHFSTKVALALLLIHTMAPTLLLAQGKFAEGYIITNQNDTIHGLIRDENWAKSPKKIAFKSGDQKVQTILAEHAKGFAIKHAEIYKSRKIGLLDISMTQRYRQAPSLEAKDSLQVFLQELVAGRATLFEFADASEHSHFFLEKEGLLKELYYYPFYKSVSDQTYLLLYDKYKEQLRVSCGDSDRFSEPPPPFQKKYLSRYIEKYNMSFLTGSELYIAEHDEFTCDIETGIGLENWKENRFEVTNKLTCGLGLRLNFPRKFHNRYAKISFLVTPGILLGFYPDPIRKRMLKTFEVSVGRYLGTGKMRPYFGVCGSVVNRGYRQEILGLQAGLSYKRRINVELGNFCNFYTLITKTGFFLPPRISLQYYILLNARRGRMR
nr:hypothetical protein [uncultured Dyadobacter sp.]